MLRSIGEQSKYETAMTCAAQNSGKIGTDHLKTWSAVGN